MNLGRNKKGAGDPAPRFGLPELVVPEATPDPSPTWRSNVRRAAAARVLGSYRAVMAVLALAAMGSAVYFSPAASTSKADHAAVGPEAKAPATGAPPAPRSTLITKPQERTVPPPWAVIRPAVPPAASSSITTTTSSDAVRSTVVFPTRRSDNLLPLIVTAPLATTATTIAPTQAGTFAPVTVVPTTAAPVSTLSDPTTSTAPTTTTTVPTYVVPTKAQLVSPGADYWGVALDGVPQNTAALDALDATVGVAPSELEWFQGWDQPYPSGVVRNSWERGALPIITWETEPTVGLTPSSSDPTFSLSNVVAGHLDSYIRAYAQAVAAEGLPVVIRFDQEMNGNWFPWSEGVDGNPSGSYVAAWRHVWNIFQAEGANTYAIWLWAPNRIDRNLRDSPGLSHFYPGDEYVDLVGVDAYYRCAGEPPTFADTFGQTLTQLRSLTAKPEFIAETAAIETDPRTGSSEAADKAAWTASLFAGLRANPQIIGFNWFDNLAAVASGGRPVTDDWRLDSDPQTLQAFKTGLANGRFSVGIIPTPGQSPPPLQEAAVTTTAGTGR